MRIRSYHIHHMRAFLAHEAICCSSCYRRSSPPVVVESYREFHNLAWVLSLSRPSSLTHCSSTTPVSAASIMRPYDIAASFMTASLGEDRPLPRAEPKEIPVDVRGAR